MELYHHSSHGFVLLENDCTLIFIDYGEVFCGFPQTLQAYSGTAL
jgi:hypothetical protein